MGDFTMPALGPEMEAGRLISWNVSPGDHVERGQIVATVDTDKAEIDVEVFDTGVVDEILVHEGEEVPVGTVLARVRTEGESPGEGREGDNGGAPRPAAIPGPATGAAPAVAERIGRVRVSPLARRVAADLGVDLTEVTGTGEGGAITRRDVEAAAARRGLPPTLAAAPAAAEATTAGVDTAAMRFAIGRAMARSKREIPHYYLGSTIEIGNALAWLERVNAERPIGKRLLSAALLLKAAATAATEVPEINGTFEDATFRPSEAVHLGIAISLRRGGLVAPAILDAANLTLDQLMASLRDLVQRARTGRLRGSEISGATLTVSNLGDQGAETVFGVIYPPQVALVGFGRVVKRPWASGGMIGVKPTLAASLSGDHRVSDGHRGGVYLAAIERLLREPEKL